MKIICVGRNYVEHIKELGNKTPDNPVIFFKTQDSLSFKNEITSKFYKGTSSWNRTGL